MKKSVLRKLAYVVGFVMIAAFGVGAAVHATLPDDRKFPSEARAALKHAESATLYALGGRFSDGTESETLYRYPILGKVELDATKTRQAAQAVLDAVPLIPPLGIAMCFDPHHALRVQHEGHQYDFVICYKCSNEAIYKDGKDIAFIAINGTSTTLDGLLGSLKPPQAQ